MPSASRPARRPGLVVVGPGVSRRLAARVRRCGLWTLALAPWTSGPASASQLPTDAADRLRVLSRMVEAIGADYADVATVTVGDLIERLEADAAGEVVLVDVRAPEERAVSALPGAIDAAAFESRLAERGSLGAMVVAYCTVGVRSSEYARRMARRGARILNLEGGVLAWSHAGREFRSGGRPTRRLHVYGRRWNLAAAGYEAVW